jgi:hypothetical protein
MKYGDRLATCLCLRTYEVVTAVVGGELVGGYWKAAGSCEPEEWGGTLTLLVWFDAPKKENLRQNEVVLKAPKG